MSVTRTFDDALFADPSSGVGLSCRRYLTPDGYQGAPTLEQLRIALSVEP